MATPETRSAAVIAEEKGSKDVLNVLDNAKISLFHLKAVVVAGAGFFTDAYDLFSISLLTRILGRLYYQESPIEYQDYVAPGSLPVNVDAAVSGVALCGTLGGQLLFGYLGDQFGRKAVYGLVLAIMIMSAIAQSMSFGTTGKAVIGTLCFFRFFLGLGVGGDYPLSATIMSEYSSRLSRGAFVSAVFAQQGTGILTAATVTIIVVSSFRHFFPAGSFPDRQLVLGTYPPISASLNSVSCPPFVYYNDFTKRPEFGLATLNMNSKVTMQEYDAVIRMYPNITWFGTQYLNSTETVTWAPHVPYWDSTHAAVSSSNAAAATVNPIKTIVPTFCDPAKYANQTVRCPFRLVNDDGSLFTPSGAQNFINTKNPGDSTYKWNYCINFIDYGGSTGGDPVTDNGGVRVNEDTGAPKMIDFPKLNQLTQAFYWTLVKQSVPLQCDWIWRIILLFGFFPAACTLYIRHTLPETPRFTLHVEGDNAKMAQDMGEVTGNAGLSAEATKSAFNTKMPFGVFVRKHAREIVGCAMGWFLLDVAFYSQNLFQKDVFTQINWLPSASAVNAMSETFKVARAQALISLGSTIPGYWFTVFTVDRMGRIKIQLMGFVIMTALMAALAGAYPKLLDRSKSFDYLPTVGVNGFVAMYALTFFFANWGPNATTFVIPAELFPTVWKSTAHGFSAAMGKAGAIIGAFGFLYASKPFEGEYSWQPNYGGAPRAAWLWKPNCPSGLSAKSWAGNVWDSHRAPLWGPCACHPNQKWIGPSDNPTSTFKVLYADLPNGNVVNYVNQTVMKQAYGYSYDAAGKLLLNDTYVTYDWLAAHKDLFLYGPHTGYADNATVDGWSWSQQHFAYSGTIAGPLSHNFYDPMTQATYSHNLLTPPHDCMPYGTGIRGALGILAGTNFLGMLFTFLLPETKGKTLEELSGEVDEAAAGAPAAATAV